MGSREYHFHSLCSPFLKVDWLIVSSQLYFTINLEEIFYFGNKKCRIYAAFGVSQTPNECYLERRKISYEIEAKTTCRTADIVKIS